MTSHSTSRSPMLTRALRSCIRRTDQRSSARTATTLLCAPDTLLAVRTHHKRFIVAQTADAQSSSRTTIQRAPLTQRTTTSAQRIGAGMAHVHSNHAAATASATVAPASAASSSSSAPAPAAAPLPRTVEIEKKVLIHSDTERILQRLGFREQGAPERIVDLYVDDNAATLTRRNYWLRRRDQGWELKLPASTAGVALASQSGGMTRYEEITDDAAITAALEALFDRSKPLELSDEETAELSTPVADLHITAADESGWPKLMALIRQRKCIPITHLCTTRRTLQWDAAASSSSSASSTPHPHSLFLVVLDAAEYFCGRFLSHSTHHDATPPASLRTYSVAEVEIVLTGPTEAQMKEAEQQVEEFAKLIEAAQEAPTAATSGASIDSLPKGKIERYLALFRPAHYRLLTSRRK